ncbi:MAG: hypothetical protein R3D60_05015 [Paracoccaceae bacterium]
MKPNFALRLSNDGIELVHRSTGGWLSVGQVDFASDDVGAACARLVADAECLEPGGLRTKLILPNSELRYATVAAPGPTDEARRYQIEAEIESLTPYGVEDLVYDWAVEGDFAMVVIGARETLAEAEAFAEGYGFKPVSFVAIPENGEFPREPFLGLTAVSRIHLSGKDPLSQDAEPVRITGRAVIPAPVAAQPAKPAAPAAEDKPGARDDASRTVAKPPMMPAMPRSSAPVTPAPARSAPPAPVLPKIPAPAPAKAEGAEPLSKVGDLVRRMGTRLRREQAAEAREKPVAPPAAAAPVAPAPKPVAAPVAPAALTPVTPAPAASAPAAPKPASAPPARPVVAAVVPETREDAPAPVAFASRRAAPPATNPAAKPSTSGNPGGRIAVLPQTDTARKGLGDTVGAFAARLRTAGTDVLGRLKPAASSAPVARKASAPLEPLVPASRPPANERDKAREAEALTIFGARGQQKPAGSFARGGLIAVGGGLLVLVSVAVWAIYFSGSDEPVSVADLPTPQETPVETATIAAPDSVVPQTDTDSAATDMAAAQPATDSATTQTVDAATTAPVDETLAAPVQQAAESAVAEAVAAGSAAVSEGVAAALPDADPDRAIEALVQEALREPVPAEVAVQAPDIAAQASDAAEIALDAPQATSLSSPLSLPGALDLGDAPETALIPPAPPPPPGATFDFDENGLVLATPDGALTPSGVTVFARRPSSAPVARPAGIAPTPVAAVAEQAAAAPETVAPVAEAAPAAPVVETAPVVADDTPRADPALAGARPQPRSPGSRRWPRRDPGTASARSRTAGCRPRSRPGGGWRHRTGN